MHDHRRIALRLATGLIAAVALVGAGQLRAAEPSISVEGGETLSNYQAYVDQLGSLIMSHTAAAANTPGSGTTRYFDFNRSLADIPGFATMPDAERALIEGAKRTYDLFKALGGLSIDSFGVAEIRDGRYYLTLDGEGGRWVDSPGEALTFLVQQLVQHQLVLVGSGNQGMPCPFDFRCLLRATYEGDVDTIAYVPRGTTVTLTLTGNGFEIIGGPPVIVGAGEIYVHSVEFIDSETISARVSILSDAPIGVNVLSVFNEDTGFRSLERYGLHVVASADELEALISTPLGLDADAAPVADAVPTTSDQVLVIAGSGEVDAIVDDFGTDAGTAGELASWVSGRLEQAGDADLFKIVVDTSGRLTLASEGPTDVAVVLEDADGTVIAADDDSGPRYNFAIDTPVTAGTYYLRVTHCCGGRGAYRISKSFQAN